MRVSEGLTLPCSPQLLFSPFQQDRLGEVNSPTEAVLLRVPRRTPCASVVPAPGRLLITDWWLRCMTSLFLIQVTNLDLLRAAAPLGAICCEVQQPMLNPRAFALPLCIIPETNP